MKRIYSGLLAILFFLPVLSYGQASKPLNWFHLDLKDDTVFGISMEKTYKELLKNKNPATVIVAVIDCGADTGHADLKTVLWRNVKETAGNGKDDDGNGYIDDVNGWNFLGWSKGDIIFENEEIVREIRRYSALFAGKDSNTIAKKRLSDYRRFKQLEAELAGKRKPMEQTRKNLLDFRNMANGIAAKIGKKNPTIEEFKNFIPSSEIEMGVLVAIVKAMKNNSNFESYIGIDLDKILEPLNQELDYKLNVDYDPRSGEAATEFAKKKGRYYGIPSPMSTDASHGTHVSGIIGADRTNGIGMMGVSGNVSIMNIRIVPDGDERDIDLANAIRYAVDNGAKIINMSFGKTSSPEKKLVDVAVKYALRKGVLFVHAAGNNAKNIDEEVVYPTRRFLNGKEVSAWIEVGASDAANNEFLPASFSNYGQRTVDVYAPGVEIYSLVLGNKYEVQSGTSMAAPVVSGLAATLWGYYPRLSANQLKEIIIKSVVKVPQLTDKCISGGVVNAYNAFILASTY